MFLNLSNGSVLEVARDTPVSVGWQEPPDEDLKKATIEEVEKLLGYEVIVYDGFTNPSTKIYWMKISKLYT